MQDPVFFVAGTSCSDSGGYRELLTYCFPWINIICLVPLTDLRSVIVSKDDLECCDAFVLDVEGSVGSPTNESGEEFFMKFESIHKQRGSLDWFSLKSRTVCSRFGWTTGDALGWLTTEVRNATFHVLIYDLGAYTRLP